MYPFTYIYIYTYVQTLQYFDITVSNFTVISLIYVSSVSDKSYVYFIEKKISLKERKLLHLSITIELLS